MGDRFYTALFPFCGSGLGAMGFAESEARLFGKTARFRILGGIDNDPAACADFEYLTDAPAWCANIEEVTASDLRNRYGAGAPDVVVITAPCKGASSLLSKDKARTEKYRRLNRLALRWVERMLEAWPTPPRLVLFENVPRLPQRAGGMLRRIKTALRRAGYVFHDQSFECGELGGLAQIRRRFLMVARQKDRCPPLLYQPPKKRVRGCGEVIGPLPMPGDPAGGPMHNLPRLSWLNWVRLALIPAGGDWRDLEGVLRDGQARREVFKRHGVQKWTEPSATVAGSGSNGPSAVADPRFGANLGAHHNKMRVEDWAAPAHTVTGSDRVGSGAPSVADPRVRVAFDHGYGVLRWNEPSPTVAGGSHPGQGAYSVADPRGVPDNRYNGFLGVIDWAEPSGVVTGNARPSSGRFAVADPRLGCTPRSGAYGVLTWEAAAKTITGSANIDNGAFAIADPRKPPPFLPIIIAADGTWHRPLTTLELAVLQSFPAVHKGAPLKLHGENQSAWRERIGNAAPRHSFRAIGDQMLFTLMESDMGGFSLRGIDTPVWVEREQAVMQ